MAYVVRGGGGGAAADARAEERDPFARTLRLCAVLCGLAGAHPDWYNDPGQHTGLAAWYLRRARWFHELVTDGDDPPLVTFNNFIMLNIIIAGVLVGLMTCAPRRARRAARALSAAQNPSAAQILPCASPRGPSRRGEGAPSRARARAR